MPEIDAFGLPLPAALIGKPRHTHDGTSQVTRPLVAREESRPCGLATDGRLHSLEGGTRGGFAGKQKNFAGLSLDLTGEC